MLAMKQCIYICIQANMYAYRDVNMYVGTAEVDRHGACGNEFKKCFVSLSHTQRCITCQSFTPLTFQHSMIRADSSAFNQQGLPKDHHGEVPGWSFATKTSARARAARQHEQWDIGQRHLRRGNLLWNSCATCVYFQIYFDVSNPFSSILSLSFMVHRFWGNQVPFLVNIRPFVIMRKETTVWNINISNVCWWLSGQLPAPALLWSWRKWFSIPEVGRRDQNIRHMISFDFHNIWVFLKP